MKNKNEMKGRVLAVVSTAMMFVFYIILSLFYSKTDYLLISYLSQICLLSGVTNTLFCAIKYFDTQKILRKNRPKTEMDEFEEELKKYNEKQRLKKRGLFKTVFGEKKEKPKKEEKKSFVDIIVIFALFVGALVFINFKVAKTFLPYSDKFTVTFWATTVLIIIAAVTLVFDKLCKHSENNTDFVAAILSNSRKFFKVIGAVSIVTAISTAIMALGLFDVQKYVRFFHIAVFYYLLLFILVSVVVIIIRKELFTKPLVKIPLPFAKDGNENFNFVEFFEENTGISMRSLWSIKYIRRIAPATVLAIVVLLWLSTGIKQIEPYQEAAVYRLGRLQSEILKPGMHLTLPYPFDKVRTYDTKTLKKVTIGYRSQTDADNIWTAAHGDEEYKLLLGGAEELVSINLRIEYRISDLKKYLQNISQPDLVMEAQAYELVTDKTIRTDLATLLSIDRDAFSETFKKELTQKIKNFDMGIEIVSVVLESIHPPVEIASVYQQIISAGIDAEKIILNAQAQAAVKVAEAQASYDTAVNTANADYHKKVSAAKSSVAEFTASLEASKKYGSNYQYQKYLSSVCQAYQKANLIIVGEGVDSSRIYLGSFNSNSEKETTTQEPVTQEEED